MKRAFLSCAVVVALLAGQSLASVPVNLLDDGFEGGVMPAGWVSVNNSNPATSIWQITTGYAGVGPKFGSYYASCGDFSVGGDYQGIADNWLLSPVLTIKAGDQLTFWTMARAGQGDSLEVWYSKAGTSTNVGVQATAAPLDPWTVSNKPMYDAYMADVEANRGDFTSPIMTINPYNGSEAFPHGYTDGEFTVASHDRDGYPSQYVQLGYTFAEDFTGRIGFRYLVHNTGGGGSYGYSLGVDDIQVTPEPASLILMGMGGLALLRRRSAR